MWEKNVLFLDNLKLTEKPNSKKGQFEINDVKGKGHEEVNIVAMLRSGWQIDNSVKAPMQPEDMGRDEQVEEEKKEAKEKDPVKDNTEHDKEATPPSGSPPKTFVPKAP